MAAPRSIETPMTRTNGLIALTASAMPPASPPPDKGTMTASSSGTSSISSKPMVPCPAMIAGSSKGGTSIMPSSAMIRATSAIASSCDRPTRRMPAPSASIALALVSGTSVERQIVAWMPSCLAAYAMARPWLPVEAQTTPLMRSSRARSVSAFAAPRILKAPVGWTVSSFSRTSCSSRADNASERTVGVRSASAPIAWRAAKTLASVRRSDMIKIPRLYTTRRNLRLAIADCTRIMRRNGAGVQI